MKNPLLHEKRVKTIIKYEQNKLFLVMEIMDNEQWKNQRPYNREVNLLTDGVIPLLDNKPGNHYAYKPNC